MQKYKGVELYMAEIVKVRYCTDERKNKINPENVKKYEKYLRSSILKDKEVENTTYRTYKNYFTQFLVYISEEWDNIDLYSEEFIDDAVDIMEGFMTFCQDKLSNRKKVINTKLSAISSFYIWSVKRRLIKYHPFQGSLTRMKNAQEEKVVNAYFLNEDEIAAITNELARYNEEDCKYDIMDNTIWNVMLVSANRIGAIDKLTISSFNKETMCFENIREKNGYRIEVSLDEPTVEIVQKWLDYRKENLDGLTVDAMWISKYGGKWHKCNKTTIQDRIRKIGNIIGLEDFHAHCIRKTCSNRLHEAGVDIETCAELLNHKSSETTRKFYCKPKTKLDVRREIQTKLKELNDKNNK